MPKQMFKPVRTLVFLAAALFPAFILTPLASAQARRAPSGKLGLNRVVNTPCTEKRLRLNGRFQAQYTVTSDPGGETFIKADFDAGRVSALGLDSANKYQASGTSHFDSRGPSPIEFSYVFNFLISKGRSPDSMMGHVKFRVAVNDKGEVRTEIIDFNIDCNQ